ncbi:MAG: ArsR/SmtB family transcription factor [Nitrososphaerales archaeon]
MKATYSLLEFESKIEQRAVQDMQESSVIKEYDEKIPETIRRIMDALAQETRRGILMILKEKGKLSFKELLDTVQPMSNSNLSNHLKILVQAGLVENIYEKSLDKDVYSIYKLSQLGGDFLETILIKT